MFKVEAYGDISGTEKEKLIINIKTQFLPIIALWRVEKVKRN